MIQMVYQKANGDIIERIRTTYPSYRVGDRTSMGWKVLSIKYFYKGKYYNRIEYDKLIDKTWQRAKKRSILKKKITELYHNLSFIFTLFLMVRAYDFLNIL